MSDTGWYIVALMSAGLVMLFLEVITPSAGALTIGAIVSLLAGVVISYQVSPLLSLALGLAVLVGVPLYLKMVVTYLPNTALGRRLILGKVDAQPGQSRPESSELDALSGKTGLAETYLRPSGAVRIEGKRYVASAESGLIARGETVKVVRTRGLGIVVRRVAPTEGESPAPPSDVQEPAASPPPTFTPGNPPDDKANPG
jgi:membrane-bound serine protease (ClpP class)